MLRPQEEDAERNEMVQDDDLGKSPSVQKDICEHVKWGGVMCIYPL